MYLSAIKRKLQPYVPNSVRFTTGVFLVVVIGILSWGLWRASRSMYALGITPRTLIQLIVNPDGLVKSTQGKTSILLLGMSGGDHEGSDLADTIIVATYIWDTNKLFVTSIPRDIWIPSLQDKINTAFHYGVEKGSSVESGLIYAKSVVEEAVGLPIHYAVKIDFAGFKNIIDVVGGINVQVPESFSDTQYPIEGKENDECNGDRQFACRYTTISFEQGREHMNGDRVLTYVRSRHAQGVEGSDISRGKRQLQVLFALRQTLLTKNVILSPTTLRELGNAVLRVVDTDMQPKELAAFGRIITQMSRDQIQTITIPAATESGQMAILINPPLSWYYNRWVLIPFNKDFEIVHRYIACQIESQTDCDEFTSPGTHSQ